MLEWTDIMVIRQAKLALDNVIPSGKAFHNLTLDQFGLAANTCV